MNLADILIARQDANVNAFLHVLREGESSQSDDAYRMLYGGQFFDISNGWQHPHIHLPLSDGQTTSAAGAYQAEARTWDDVQHRYGLTDFSPPNQDIFAVVKLADRHALDDVKGGLIDAAIRKLTQEWTSLALPHRQAVAAEIFTRYGGTLASHATPEPAPLVVPQPQPPQPAQPKEVKTMGPAVLAFLPQLLGLIPALGNLFGSGSPVQQRNVAAAQVVGDTLVKAVDAVNVQDAIEKMQGDKDALAAATAAVHEILPQLLDVGGGVETARKFASDHESSRYGRVLEVVTYAGLFFLLAANAAAFAFAWRSDDFAVMADLKQADIGVAMIVFGFWLGTSISSKRKDETRGAQ